MAPRPKIEEHENHERWLVSYADFITLLFAFFVVMYSISSVNEGKFRVLSESLVASFRSPEKSLEPIQVGKLARSPYNQQIKLRQQPGAINMEIPSEGKSGLDKKDLEKMKNRIKELEQLTKKIQASMKPLIDDDLVSVRRTDLWVEVEIKSSILFNSGSAHLSQQSLPLLQRLSGILAPLPNTVHVEGFTDNIPIRTVAYPSNWELSAARAASVVHLFVKAGMDPLKLAAIGYGEYRPVADNSTAEGRSRNRRVVLIIQGFEPPREKVYTEDKTPSSQDATTSNSINAFDEKQGYKPGVGPRDFSQIQSPVDVRNNARSPASDIQSAPSELPR